MMEGAEAQSGVLPSRLLITTAVALLLSRQPYTVQGWRDAWRVTDTH